MGNKCDGRTNNNPVKCRKVLGLYLILGSHFWASKCVWLHK